MNLHLLALTLLAPLALQGAQQSASATPVRTDANAAAAAPVVPVDRGGNPIATHAETDSKSSAAAPSQQSMEAPLAPEDATQAYAKLQKHIANTIEGLTSHQIRERHMDLIVDFVGKMVDLSSQNVTWRIDTLVHLMTEEQAKNPHPAQAITLDTLSHAIIAKLMPATYDTSRLTQSFPLTYSSRLITSLVQRKPIPLHYHPKTEPYLRLLQQLTSHRNAKAQAIAPTELSKTLLPDLINIVESYYGTVPPTPLSITNLVSYRDFYAKYDGEYYKLDLSDNELTSIHDVHLTFLDKSSPPRTSYVVLRRNHLTSLPIALRHKFVHCNNLDLAHNKLVAVDIACLPLSLQYLDLSHNEIRSLPLNEFTEYIGQLTGGRHTFIVDLIGNPLLNDPHELEKINKLRATGIKIITEWTEPSLPSLQ